MTIKTALATITFCVLCLLINTVKAQPKSGDFFLEGSVYGNIVKAYSPDTNFLITRRYTSAQFTPKIGAFIFNRIAVGVTVDLRYSNQIETEHITDTNSDLKLRVDKSRHISYAMGGFVSYYQPVRKNLLWVSTLTYLRGYTADGISFAALVSPEHNTFTRVGFSNFLLTTGISYFFKPNVCITANTGVASFINENRKQNVSWSLKNISLSVGLTYLIVSENE